MVATVVVGLLFAVAIHTVGSARLGQYKTARSSTGCFLAQQLMSEILNQAYEDPDVVPVLGPEAGEVVVTSRANFDDVDDYHGWSSSPPRQRDGTQMSEFSDWTRSVVVEYVKDTDLTASASGDEGIKRIIVTVKHKNVPVAELTALRTVAWPGPTER